ncbi:MAG: LUD domain-containing protein [Hyphomicrobiales bacterium]
MKSRSGVNGRSAGSGRAGILAKIRKNIPNADDPKRQTTVSERLAKNTVGLIPARGRKPQTKRVDLFCEQAAKVQATVTRISSIRDLPDALSEYLRGRNLPQKMRMGDDPLLAKPNWKKTPNLEVFRGPSDGQDLVSLSHAFAGVAETGTLMLQSGADNPSTLNFLPETHCVVINASDISGDYESAWQVVREQHGKGQMPRTVNMITGPSRSGDIEQTILLGAHGPRALQIFVIDDS